MEAVQIPSLPIGIVRRQTFGERWLHVIVMWTCGAVCACIVANPWWFVALFGVELCSAQTYQSQSYAATGPLRRSIWWLVGLALWTVGFIMVSGDRDDSLGQIMGLVSVMLGQRNISLSWYIFQHRIDRSAPWDSWTSFVDGVACGISILCSLVCTSLGIFVVLAPVKQ